jgi:hypothetical protein
MAAKKALTQCDSHQDRLVTVGGSRALNSEGRRRGGRSQQSKKESTRTSHTTPTQLSHPACHTHKLACGGKEGHAWVRLSHTAMITQRTLLERLVTKKGWCDGRWRTLQV